MQFIQLLNDQTFESTLVHELDEFENGSSILFCSFTGDSNVYYCIGTACVLGENEPTKVKMHFSFLLCENLRRWILLLSRLGFLVFYLLTTAGKDIGFHCGRWEVKGSGTERNYRSCVFVEWLQW